MKIQSAPHRCPCGAICTIQATSGQPGLVVNCDECGGDRPPPERNSEIIIPDPIPPVALKLRQLPADRQVLGNVVLLPFKRREPWTLN